MTVSENIDTASHTTNKILSVTFSEILSQWQIINECFLAMIFFHISVNDFILNSILGNFWKKMLKFGTSIP